MKMIKKIVSVCLAFCMLISLMPATEISAAYSNSIYDETGKTYTVGSYGVLGSGSNKTLSFVFGVQSGPLATDTGILLSDLSSNTVEKNSVLKGAYLKGNAKLKDGTEVFIDVPIYGVRKNSAGTLLCVEVLISDLPSDAPDKSESYKADASTYTIYSKYIPMQTYDFPEGTKFICTSEILNEPGDWSKETYDGYSIYFKGQSGTTDGPYASFETKNAGSYRLWALCKKQNDGTKRNNVVLIDGKIARFSNEVSETEMSYRWEKDTENNVILLKRGEEFNVRLLKESDFWGRIAALALVPATADLEGTDLSGNVIYDSEYQFSMSEMLENQNENFSVVAKGETLEATVSVDGESVDAIAAKAVLSGADVSNVDKDGGSIYYPTVADALICSGKVSASEFKSGTVKAKRIKLNGETIKKCDTTRVFEDDVITITEIDNTNFEPVSYGALKGAEGSYYSMLKLSPNIDTMLQTELSFAINDNGALKTGSTGLKGCYLNGYVETTKAISGKTTDGITYTLPKGSKVYFANVKISYCVNPSGSKSGLIPDPSVIKPVNYSETNGYGDHVIKLDNGTYIPDPFSFAYGADYDASNLFITNKNTTDELIVEENDGRYLISSNSYKYIYLVKATYSDDNRLLGVEQISDFVSVGSPVLVELKPNQRAFLWDNSVTTGNRDGVEIPGGTKMIPLASAMEYDGDYAQEFSTEFPSYAKEIFEAVETESIENESNKMVFFKGENLVQSEIYTKNKSGEWVKSKSRDEDFGFLMMKAYDAEYLSGNNTGISVNISRKMGNAVFSKPTSEFYEMGNGTWLIPSDFEKISDNKIKLYFENQDKVTFTATYEFDSLSDDIKVTADALFNEKGAYSFMFFNGDGVEYEDYDTVTAPFYYVKHAVPDSAILINEPLMFTPMNTLHFPENGIKAEGEEITIGVAVDPECVSQGYPLMRESKFATMFRTPDGKIRSSIVAPVMGNPASKFEAGEEFNFSVRLLNRTEGWYDTFKHVAQDLFNCTDLRTNYYGSVNDAIYNVNDLMMDDYYGGFDSEWMGWYNMEAKNCVTQANYLSSYQHYLLTNDNEVAEERVVPTIAYMLSRGRAHYLPTDDISTVSYGSENTPLAGNVNQVATVYGGLYEMSQGRMPYLLDYALQKGGKDIFDYIGIYKYTKDEAYREEIIDTADSYLDSYPNSESGRETPLINGFVYGDYIKMVNVLLAAYETTGEQKYLEKAEECGRLLMTVVWTTDYQNDYATTDFYVDPIKESERPIHFDNTNFNFWWHGDIKFRPGSPVGEVKSITWLTQNGSAILDEETVPGWLLAKAGLGTEHASTPANNNVITMNNWLGAMVRLSEYTGDSFFETQARNAIIGRYQNYPGYYLDRFSTQYYKADYPYVGPDISGIYWHHIPIFSSMVQDFLINEAWAKSNRKIDFPYIYQRGYAYFDSYQFGHAPGKMYDVDGLWLWLDRGVINPDSVNVDYVAARKDGVVSVALMNESGSELTTVVTLGEKLGNTENASARQIDAKGNSSSLEVSENKFTVTIPAKGIKTVVISDLSDVKKPSYAVDYTYSNQVYNTMTAHKKGNGYVIQTNDDYYYAYVFIKDQNSIVPKATLTYTVDGVTKTITDENLNHEWLIRVDDSAKSFEYSIECEKADGTKENYGGGLLEPLSKTVADGNVGFTGIEMKLKSSPVYFDEEPPAENTLEFTPFKLNVSSHGALANKFRLVCDESKIKAIVGDDLSKVVGLRAKGTFTAAGTNAKINVEQYIVGTDRSSSGAFVLLLAQPSNLSTKVFGSNSLGNFDLTIYPQ